MKKTAHNTHQKYWFSAAISFALFFMAAAPRSAFAQTNTYPFPSTGNVGIGTTSPTQPLDVAGNIVTTGSQTLTVANKGVIEVTNTITNNASSVVALRARNIFNGSGNTPQGLDVVPTFAPSASINLARSAVVGGFFAPPSGVTITDAMSGNFVNVYSNVSGAVTTGTTLQVDSPIIFASLKPTTQYGLHIRNQGATGMTTNYGFFVDSQSGATNNYAAIFAGGNVGIGTTTPGRPLEIADGNPGLGTQLRLYHTEGDAGVNPGSTEIEFLHSGNQLATSKMRVVRTFNQMGSSNTDFSLDLVKGNAGDNGNTTNTVLFAQGLTGYVGIGTSTPSSKLHLFSGGASDNVLQSFQNGTRNWTVGINGASDFFRVTDQTAGVARLAILNNGNVGIGTTTPGATYKLDVAGTVNASGFKIDGAAIISSQWNSNGTAINYVQGNVGIGTGMLAPGYALDVAGDIHSTTGIRFPDGNLQSTAAQGSFKYLADSGATTRITANSNNGTLQFVGAGGTTITFDDQAKRVTIDGSTSTVTASNVSPGQFAAGNYTFPGNVTVTGTLEGGIIRAKFQDVAEWVPSSEEIPAGTVVALDTTKSNQVIASTQAYDTRVAGVVSEQPGIALGESGKGKVLVATTGRVLVKVDATNNPIHIGDLLVTSDIPGVAMKSEPITIGNRKFHTPGTLIGKALEPLEKGSGKILVLLSLQ